MTQTSISQLFEQSPQLRKLGDAIAHFQNSAIGENRKINVKGLVGSSLSFVFSHLFRSMELPFLLILNDKEEAAYYLNDLEQLIGEKDVLFYPGSYRRPYQIEETDNANVLLRAEVLNRINSRKKPAVIVTYPDALFEKVVTRKELDKNTLKIKLEDTLSLDFLNEVLFEYQFKRVDFVTEPGEFSVRGGIVDVFSFSHDEPYRIEFFGDEVDSIRTFDVETQLSHGKSEKNHHHPQCGKQVFAGNPGKFSEIHCLQDHHFLQKFGFGLSSNRLPILKRPRRVLKNWVPKSNMRNPTSFLWIPSFAETTNCSTFIER